MAQRSWNTRNESESKLANTIKYNTKLTRMRDALHLDRQRSASPGHKWVQLGSIASDLALKAKPRRRRRSLRRLTTAVLGLVLVVVSRLANGRHQQIGAARRSSAQQLLAAAAIFRRIASVATEHGQTFAGHRAATLDQLHVRVVHNVLAVDGRCLLFCGSCTVRGVGEHDWEANRFYIHI